MAIKVLREKAKANFMLETWVNHWSVGLIRAYLTRRDSEPPRLPPALFIRREGRRNSMLTIGGRE